MLNPIKSIVDFNHKAGLLDKPYDDFLESSFLIEEALEGFLNNHALGGILHTTSSPEDIARVIVAKAQSGDNPPVPISDVNRLDKACDAVVYAIGSMAKLGLNAQEITQALNIVMRHNNMKLGAPKDEFGKQLKPEGWTGPEPELQALLDRRK